MNPEITPENIKTWLPGTFPGDMAIEPLEISDERPTGRMVVDKRHLHPGGFVHGGVWTAFGDSVAAWATFRALPPNHDFTTIELKLNVFSGGRARRRADLRSKAAARRPQHRGDRGQDPQGREARWRT